MKKIIAWLLCSVFLVVFSSCAGSPDSGTEFVSGSTSDLQKTDRSDPDSTGSDTDLNVTDSLSGAFSSSSAAFQETEDADVSDETDFNDPDGFEETDHYEGPGAPPEDPFYENGGEEDPESDWEPDAPEFSDTNTETDTDRPSSSSSSSTQGTPPATTDNPTNPVPEKTVSEVLSSAEHYVGLCDQKNSRVIICDLAVEDWSDDKAVVWEYLHDNKGRENLGWIAGLKFRNCPYYGGKIMIYCYPDHARIVSMDTKKTLLETNYSGVNPHSAEVLPDGTVIVASTNDNWVGIYPPGQKDAASTITFPLAHGVLWDPQNQFVWLAGDNDLGAFRVVGSGSSLRLEPVVGKRYETPKGSVHDLAPLYGNSNKLLVTCASGAVLFDKNTETFSYNYSGGEVGKTFGYIPGCGNFTDGVFAFTAIASGTKVYQDWDTNVIQVYVPTGNGKGSHVKRIAPDDAYYKLRVYNFNYQ